MRVIYKITNKINNKIYIGQTDNLKARIKYHINMSIKPKGSYVNSEFHKDIKLYGINNFIIEIIDKTDDINMSNKLEKYYISKFDSTNSDIGYNRECGGGVGLWSDEARKRMSKRKDYIDILGLTKKRGENHNAVKILCLNNNTIYDCIMDCAEDLFPPEKFDTARIKISNCANPNSNKFSYYGYEFRYLDENGNIISKNTQELSRGKYNRGMKIIEINTKKIFNTIVEASKWCKLSESSIRDRIYGRVKNVGEYDFRNYEEYIANGETLTDNADGNPVLTLEDIIK